MKIYLILPASEHLKIKTHKDQVPKRKMLRFSVLSLTTVAALTPDEHEVVICDENVEPLDLDFNADVVGISFMTGLAPRAYEIAAHFRKKGCFTVAGGFHPTLCTDEVLDHFDIVVRGEAKAGIGALQLAILTPQPGTPLREKFEAQARIIDSDWRHYDYRHTVIEPKLMSSFELQNGADWLYRNFYRLDRILLRTIKTAFKIGIVPAYLTFKLNMTYRYDNIRDGVRGFNPNKIKSIKNVSKQPVFDQVSRKAA